MSRETPPEPAALAPSARPPLDARAPTVAPYTGPAAGRGALVSSLKEVAAHTGLFGGAQLLARVNQRDGFDCPGCAWPDPDHRSAFEFCENGVKAVAAEGTTRRVTAEFFAEHSLRDLSAKSDHWLEAQGRLTRPMWLPPGATRYEPISWEGAFARLAGALKGAAHPDRCAFYTSGRTSSGAWAPTTSPTAPTCAMSRVGAGSPRRSGRARARCS